MKILLDHCVPRPFRRHLEGHEVKTAFECGWSALSNGMLLREAMAAGFDVFVTVDQNLQYQQNLSALPLSVLMLVSASSDADALAACAPHLPAAFDRIAASTGRGVPLLVRVDKDGLSD